jgi:hypothetical protein
MPRLALTRARAAQTRQRSGHPVSAAPSLSDQVYVVEYSFGRNRVHFD